MTRGRRWTRRMVAVALVAVLAVGAVRGPDALRAMEVFRVQRVEVVGSRFLDPYAVVRAAGLHRAASLFDDADAWEAGVLTLSLVEQVRVRRRAPSTVVVEIEETQPVALIAAEELRPVDATGRLLELEPAGVVLDLPIVTGLTVAGASVAAGESAGAITTVAALLERAPELAERMGQAELRDGALRITLRRSRAEVVVPAFATELQLRQLRLTVADLATRGEMEKVRTIDVRFRDQVVVSFLNRPVS